MHWKRGLLVLACIVTTILAQSRDPDPQVNSISKGAEEFALELFANVCKELDGISKNNFMISPFSIWALLLLVAEGATGNTLLELERTLRLPANKISLRQGYRSIQESLRVKTGTVELATLQGIFYNKDHIPYANYSSVVRNDYEATVVPIDYSRPDSALATITDFIKRATRGFIQPNMSPDDLYDAQILMISSIFFKGQWAAPFNTSLTKEVPFYDEDGHIIAQVEMMTQTAMFNFAPFVEMQSHILELPYGNEKRLSMLLIIPKRGVPLLEAITNLRKVGLQNMFTVLSEREALMAEYEGDDVEVFLPKFTTSTDINMNAILENMGIREIFSEDAELNRLTSQQVYLSRLIHQAKIEVNEEGTIAAAVSTAQFANKASPPRFYLNRPFAYLIVEKTTRTLLFCGRVNKPVYNK